MNLDTVSAAINEISQSREYDGSFIFGRKPFDEGVATISYIRPTLDEITNVGKFKLSIKEDDERCANITSYINNLKNAPPGNYYGPFKISVFEEIGLEIEIYFLEYWIKKITKLSDSDELFLVNENGSSTMIHRYIVDPTACDMCDLSLVPTRKRTDMELSSCSKSESEDITLIHYDPKCHGTIYFTMEVPWMPSKKFEMFYVRPLKEDIKKCSIERAFPLQFVRPDGSFVIIPCFAGNRQTAPIETYPCRFDIEVICDNGDVTSMECYILNVPALLEAENCRTTHCLVQNLKNAQKEVYYGPYKISVFDKSGNRSQFKCYFPEKYFETLREQADSDELFLVNENGSSTMIHRYIIDPTACDLCDLSLAPTIMKNNSESSSTLKNGCIKYRMWISRYFYKTFKNIYVVPDASIVDGICIFPLQMLTVDGSYLIIPCFVGNSASLPKNTRFRGPFEIKAKDKSKIVLRSNCFVPELSLFFYHEIEEDYLLELQKNDGNYTNIELYEDAILSTYIHHWISEGILKYPQFPSLLTFDEVDCCEFITISTDDIKKRNSFVYIMPSHDHIDERKNPHTIEILVKGNFKEFPCFYGNIEKFPPNAYIGPLLIQTVKQNGPRANVWMNVYFLKNSFLYLREYNILYGNQTLYFGITNFASNDAPWEDIDTSRDDTEIIKEYGYTRKIIRNIAVDDESSDESSSSDF